MEHRIFFLMMILGIIGCNNQSPLTSNEKIINVIEKDLVIVSLNLIGAFISPDSKVSFPNFGSTLILKKYDHNWKVIHFH